MYSSSSALSTMLSLYWSSGYCFILLQKIMLKCGWQTLLLASGCNGRCKNERKKSIKNITRVYANSPRTPNAKWHSRIQTDCRLLMMYRFNTNITKLLYAYTWSWIASLKDKISSRDISGEPRFSTNTSLVIHGFASHIFPGVHPDANYLSTVFRYNTWWCISSDWSEIF